MAPFVILNFMLGITEVRLRDFILGGLGMLPGLLIRLFIGTTLSAMTEESISISNIISEQPVVIVFIVGGLIVGIAGITYVTIITKRYL